MVYSLTYRRPAYIDSHRASVASEKPSVGRSTLDSSDGSINFGIPDALSFDRIIDGGTCPVSLRVLFSYYSDTFAED